MAPIMGVPRRVRVQGRAGVETTVVVTTVRDNVWLSISPPLTWEAIMTTGTVDGVISTLELARDEAMKAAAAATTVHSVGARRVTRTAKVPNEWSH